MRLARGSTGALGKEFAFLVCAHTLAECFGVLTAYPIRPRISPSQAVELIGANIAGAATIVALSAADYRSVLRQLAELGAAGGAVYDALLVQAARKAAADLLLTLNPRDFLRIWPEGEGKIRTP